MKKISEGLKEKLREFKLTTLAVDNGTSVFIITLMVLIFGLQSYQEMPKEQYPEASLPTVYINTPYFGNSAAEIENLITRPLEKEIASINGIKDIRSTSIQDFSVITAEFIAEMEMEESVRKVKDAVDKAKSELPSDLEDDPTVLEVNFSEIPIVSINVSGNYGMDELRGYAEFIEDLIEDIKEISKVDMKGAQEREVKIDVDLPKMQSLLVSFNDIEQAVASENISMSGGEIVKDNFRRSIRVIGQFEDVKELETVIVKSEDQRPVFLKDIAEITYGYEERVSYARSDGFPVISLDVIKRKGENLLDASDNIKEVLDKLEKVLPTDLKISLFNDQSVNTRDQVNNLENSIISGVILVVLVLLFFLGLRNAMFVGLAIPLSMLTAILILNLAGVTMNIVVLFALILALGLLVDNAIVVVENIYRYMQEGYHSWDAAKFGASEVAMPIIASTATTLAAFLPLAFWPGLMGEFMKYLPITLIIVLSSSLFVALVINPVFTSRFMKVDQIVSHERGKQKTKNILLGSLIMIVLAVIFHFVGVQWIRNLLAIATIITLVNYFFLRPASSFFQNKGLPKLEKIYNQFIGFALKGYNPALTFLGTILLLIFAITLLVIKQPKVEYFPSAEPIYINAFVELALGKDIEATNELMQEIEEKVEKVIEPSAHIVEAVLTQIGENTSDPNQPPEPGVSPHKARLTVSFVPTQERDGISTRQIMNDIRESLKGYAGVSIVVNKNPDGPPTGNPINIEFSGDDVDSLSVLSDRIMAFINALNIPGIEELKADVKLGKPELEINIDREAARRYNLSTMAIAGSIRTSVFGKEVSKFKEGEDEHPIQLRLSEKYRNNIVDLINQKVTFRDQSNGRIVQVPISAVADFEYNSTFSSIKRKNQQRVITIYSNVLEGYNTNEIVTELRDVMNNYSMPPGYSFEFTGEQEQQAEDMDFLSTTFIVAIFAIFLIIVAQFNSIISPFIIILSVFFSTIGVFLGYASTGQTISIIFTGVGIISLAGVVVNNAIVLIDYINLLIKRKREEKGVESFRELSNEDIKDAIIKGGATRLRPVLLTAITTVLGLIPLAIGFNINFFSFIKRLDWEFFLGGDNTAVWGPMAWTIIYGLIFATFLTLVVVPVMYWLAYRLTNFARNLFHTK
jgi:multidrug efflux pump subunit AcrB